ncbi:hypothetical protein HID58_006465, partial [Brassica napus]
MRGGGGGGRRSRGGVPDHDAIDNRILDWAEILMGIKDNSGNVADYVDDGAAEGDGGEGGGRRGAPLAAKSAIEALETFEMMMVVVCAVCKDGMVIGEAVKKLPCGDCYHGALMIQQRESEGLLT